MNLKTFRQKITASLAAVALGGTMIFSAPVAEAIDAGSIIGIGGAILSGTIQMKQAQLEIEHLNNTEKGRRELYNAFREKYGVNNDAKLNARLSSIMTNLSNAVAVVDISIVDKPYLYFISADDSVNAGCGLGHVMMVNVGTFKNIHSDDEIAAIVGHEMGHGQKDHTAKSTKKRINKATLAQIGVSAAGGGTLAGIIGTIALTNSVAHGDRKQETEADNLAWEYMLHTNYNIGACAAVQQKFVEMFGASNRSTILNPSDHPDSDKRRDNYVKKLYEYSGKHTSARDGVVTVNGKTFMTVAKTSKMSSAERSYFVLGNLAKAFHEGKNNYAATVSNGKVYLGDQEIVTPVSGDESAETLAARLNAIK